MTLHYSARPVALSYDILRAFSMNIFKAKAAPIDALHHALIWAGYTSVDEEFCKNLLPIAQNACALNQPIACATAGGEIQYDGEDVRQIREYLDNFYPNYTFKDIVGGVCRHYFREYSTHKIATLFDWKDLGGLIEQIKEA